MLNFNFPTSGTFAAPGGTIVDHVRVDLTYGVGGGTVALTQNQPPSFPVVGSFPTPNPGDYIIKATQVSSTGVDLNTQQFPISVLPSVNLAALGAGSGSVTV